MNCLFLNSIRPGVWGGGEKWMLTAAEGLRRLGHGITFAGREGGLFLERCSAHGFPVAPLRIGGDFDPRTARSLNRLFRERAVDVVVCNFNKDVRLASLASLGRARREAPVLVARNGLAILPDRLRYRLTYRRLVDGILTNTEAIRRQYLGYGWIDPSFVRVVHNGIEPVAEAIERFTPSVPEAPVGRSDAGGTMPPAETRAALGIPEGAAVLGFFGRLVGQKRPDLFLSVAAVVRRAFPETFCLIVGDGPERDTAGAQAAALGLEHRVRWTGFRERVAPLYRICDVVLLTSSHEGLPNVLMEAMQAARPCVAFDVGGVRELFGTEPGGPSVSAAAGASPPAGIAVSFGDVDAMAAEAIGLLRDRARAQALGACARVRIGSAFTAEKMVREVEAWFLELLQARRGFTKGARRPA